MKRSEVCQTINPDFRFWPEADAHPARRGGRFQGESGHNADWLSRVTTISIEVAESTYSGREQRHGEP